MSDVYFKHPSDVIDIDIDYSEWLAADTISTSTWTVPTGITQDSESETTTVATIWLSGGTDGQSYTLTNQIVTAGGRTKNVQVVINVAIPTVATTAYADDGDVTPYISGQDVTGNVTTGQIDAWCQQYSARVDAILDQNGYATVPATGTNDVLLLKGYVALGVAALTWRVAFRSDPPFVVEWDRTWEDFLTRLMSGDITLQDQSPAGAVHVIMPKVYGAD